MLKQKKLRSLAAYLVLVLLASGLALLLALRLALGNWHLLLDTRRLTLTLALGLTTGRLKLLS